ncbi:MAG: hypothetical protein JST01_24560 [Cyanobacteria bacterium SZAS TMP-1]|nr:hypothetical protein [Cyanobacteria bacterium SZAS TMP-1]
MSNMQSAVFGIICFLAAFPLSKLEKSFGLFGGFGPGGTFKYGRLLALIAVCCGSYLILRAV